MAIIRHIVPLFGASRLSQLIYYLKTMTLDSATRTKIVTIIGAAMDVHNELHAGLDEPLYQEALSIELTNQKLKWQREVPISAYYKGQKMDKHYYADFMCDGILLELKAVRTLLPEHRQQLFNYMRLTHTKLGLLINFGASSLFFERYYWNEDTNEISLFH